MFRSIDDLNDPLLADYANLTDTALRSRLEVEHGLFMAESFNVIERALTAGYQPRSILVTERHRENATRLASQFQLQETPIFIGPEPLIEQIAGFHVHRGALAAFLRPPSPPLAQVLAGARRILVLEDLVDHTNVGAAIRSGAAIGMDAIIVSPRCADPLYRRAVRVAMGTVFQIPWTRCPVWPLTGALSELGFKTVALALREDAIELQNLSRVVDASRDKVALIVGPEGHGLDQRTIQSADIVARIPMYHGVDSLNVAAAAALGCWALKTQLST